MCYLKIPTRGTRQQLTQPSPFIAAHSFIPLDGRSLAAGFFHPYFTNASSIHLRICDGDVQCERKRQANPRIKSVQLD